MFRTFQPCNSHSVDAPASCRFGPGEPWGRGPYQVGSTNFKIAPEHARCDEDFIHACLLGHTDDFGQQRFITDVLQYPESAFVTSVQVPDVTSLYGLASGRTLSAASFVTYPTGPIVRKNRYDFPYHDSMYGSFEHMLGPSETPEFADPDKRYPLIILAHGAAAHGIYDLKHAHDLSSHGYVVVVINYGDERTAPDNNRRHQAFLRPLLTKAVLDDVLDSPMFSSHVDRENIGISGHSFGGLTSLALAGGLIHAQTASVTDRRIKAGVLAAPWVGGVYDGCNVFAFGPGNVELGRVTAPMIAFFGTKDEEALPSFVLPGIQKLSGPTYVVELVDQAHVFEPGSWENRNNWELLFFSAYLKANAASLDALKTLRSMKGGNDNIQRFEFQK